MDQSNEVDDGQHEGAELACACSGRQALLVTVVEAAEILGVGRSTIYELIYADALPSVKIGHSRRIRYADLEAFVRDLVEVS